MNKVILVGRLTRDPEVRYSQGREALAIGRYTIAVDRKYKREGISTHTSLAGRDRYILYKQAVTHSISRDGQFLHTYYIHLKQTFPLLFRRTS